MFTGIIEEIGEIAGIKKSSDNRIFKVKCNFIKEIHEGDSIAHNGVCLTVEKITPPFYFVTAVKETLERTNLSSLVKKSGVNLERALLAGSRIDGHFVQGHVDSIAVCKAIKDEKGSKLFTFELSGGGAAFIVKKGAICLNGSSFTIVDLKAKVFSIAIIPYTLENTTFGKVTPGDKLNVEFDILGKYIAHMVEKRVK